jgi:predicted component of type VI protein secretion system
MNDENLRAQLEQLHGELSRTENVDADQRELLNTLRRDIQELLSREPNEPHHYRGLGERLNEAVAKLEASHPQITLLMRRAIDSLSYLGV